jgi:class 3 adenylate cyclase
MNIEAEAGAWIRRDLPTGTITLLFSDIEGSTRLLQQVGDRYGNILMEYRQLLRTTLQAHRGHEVDAAGDGFFAVFVCATDAVAAAVTVQRVLAAHAWPQGITLQARMGLHTGNPQRLSEGYIGLDVHFAARLMSAGHGGQVLLSQTTCDLVIDNLSDGVRLRDLGKHLLKDFGRPSHLFQLEITDLPADFPPLTTLDTTASAAAVEPTPLSGREQEVAAIEQLLRREDVRFLTLTGARNAGKTVLGIEAAMKLGDRFADGICFVALASLADPARVMPTIARALGIRQGSGQSLQECLRQELQQKQVLLLLDNLGRGEPAVSQVADLLAACPKLKVLVTSLKVLHVPNEHEFTVPSAGTVPC